MASGTELAKAYVQIIPSAEGIKGKITETLGGEAASAGQSAGKSIGGNLVGTLKKALVAAGIGTAIKESIEEGAALEQSIGGTETLFKDSADTMKQCASDAYKTAGMSANEYMETATGFAASLLQGLGGDTAKAADIANMSITDMSDNANKMGTDMESIKNAYAGFSKQNYTMLDNLKLGYGGTKSEMERLLADAQKLSGVEYNIDNLSDVYSAIHVIQEDLDITGTTAKEAASTLSGSLSSMKAAFTNVLGNLALGEDIGPSLEALTDTVFTFLTGNLIPMVANVIRGAPQLLSGVLTGAIRMLNIASNNADEIVQSGIEIISELANGILAAAPYLIEAAIRLVASLGNALINADWVTIANNFITTLRDNMDIAAGEILGTDGNIIQSVFSSITEKLPEVLNKGVEIISNLALGILQNLPTIISSMGTILTQLVAFILQNLPTILEAGVTLISNLALGILQNLPEIIASIYKVLINLVATIMEYLPTILQTGIKLIAQLEAGLIQAIPQLVAKIPSIIAEVRSAFLSYDWLSLGSNIIAGIADGIKAGVSTIVDAAKNAAKAALDAAKDFLGIASPSKVMKKEVGRWIPAGMAEGIVENTKPVTDAMKQLAKETAGTLQTDLEVGLNHGQRKLNQATEQGQDTAAGGYNQTVNIYSPQELSPSEVARQTRNATKNMVLALRKG